MGKKKSKKKELYCYLLELDRKEINLHIKTQSKKTAKEIFEFLMDVEEFELRKK